MSERGSILDVAAAHRRRRTGEPAHDLALFVALLRALGVAVPVGSTLTALRALQVIGLDGRDAVHDALRACLIADREEMPVFDPAFTVFWSADAPELADMGETTGTDRDAAGDEPGGGDVVELRVGGAGRDPHEQSVMRARFSSSGRRRAPVAWFADEREIATLVRRLVRALASSRGPRLRRANAAGLIDLRQSLRDSLRFGGEVVELHRLREQTDRARVVVLCDVSSSMQPYTPLFLTFVHALTRATASSEAAIFNVELCSVTDVFRRRSLPDALTWLQDRSVALAGGTRTGHCLHAFNAQIARRGLAGAHTAALVLSDGWDVGEPELLDDQLRRLSAQVDRLIWLDPHAAEAGYRPQVKGLTIAMPYVDDYLDFSSPGSLHELVGRLEGTVARGAA